MVHALSRDDARRLALRAQRLDDDRPGDVLETVDALTVVGIDPTAAIAPSADHILWSRIGWPYRPADLRRAAEVDRSVFEWRGFYRPTSDLPMYRPEMRAWPTGAQAREWLAANTTFRADVLALLADRGPTPTSDIPDTSTVGWASTGWTNNRNVTQMLEALATRGEIAVSRREGRARLWDLAERVLPDLPDLPDAEAWRLRGEARLHALGIARAVSVAQPVEPIDVGDVGEEARVDGVEGTWRVDAGLLAELDRFRQRVALLSPFDRLVFDRRRTQELFGFTYILEMYKPAAARRWGYFALPILLGDALVGKLDAKVDRRAGALRVHAVHEDRALSSDDRDAVDAEIERLAQWLGVTVERDDR